MGILLFVLLVVLVATVGFWDALAALLGAAVMIVLAVVVGIAALGAGAYLLIKRGRH
jgi:hypothetical protein